MSAIVEQKRPIPFHMMRTLVEIYYDFQHQRIMTGNRIQMNVERNQISDEDLKIFGVFEIQKKSEQFEKDIKKIFESEIRIYDIWNTYFEKIYGIGPVISCGLLAYIDDISKFENISKLWQYAGFGMNSFCETCKKPTFVEKTFKKKDSKTKTKAKQLRTMQTCPVCGNKTIPVIQHRMIGYMSNWNDKFKVLCWKIGQSFEKQGTKSGYYNIYRSIKEEEKRKHPEKIKTDSRTKYNDGHIRNMALRKTIKIFLAHLWVTWRKIEHLPITDPYVGKILNHDIIEPFTDT